MKPSCDRCTTGIPGRQAPLSLPGLLLQPTPSDDPWSDPGRQFFCHAGLHVCGICSHHRHPQLFQLLFEFTRPKRQLDNSLNFSYHIQPQILPFTAKLSQLPQLRLCLRQQQGQSELVAEGPAQRRGRGGNLAFPSLAFLCLLLSLGVALP